MIVNDILLPMRSRLGDKDIKKQRWSDEELIDMINSSLAKLSRELLLFTDQKIINIENNENRYRLPFNCIKVISINIENEPVTIKSFDWLQQNKHLIDDDDFLVCMDEQSFFLYPETQLSLDMKVELNYNYIEQIDSKTDEINISLMSKNALLFYSMHLALQINTSDKNRDKSTHYLKLYDKEVIEIRALYYANKHSKKIRSKFIKV